MIARRGKMTENMGKKVIVLKFRSRGDLVTALKIAGTNNIKINQTGPDSELQISIPFDMLGPFQSSGAITFGFEVVSQ